MQYTATKSADQTSMNEIYFITYINFLELLLLDSATVQE